MIDEVKQVGAIRKGGTDTLVARIVRINGRDCGDLRVFAAKPDGGTAATGKGVCFAVERAGDVLALVEKLAATCKRHGAEAAAADEESALDTEREEVGQ